MTELYSGIARLSITFRVRVDDTNIVNSSNDPFVNEMDHALLLAFLADKERFAEHIVNCMFISLEFAHAEALEQGYVGELHDTKELMEPVVETIPGTVGKEWREAFTACENVYEILEGVENCITVEMEKIEARFDSSFSSKGSQA